MNIKPNILEVDISLLIPAEWNYKSEGTKEQLEKLVESIKRDKSAGVPAVRELGKKYEVIDGNHRLKALKKLEVKRVTVENFGKLSKAQAIIVARRRNSNWFEDDTLRFAELFQRDVLAEFAIADLATFMSETKSELENISQLTEFNWDDELGKDEGGKREDFKTLKLSLPESLFNLWLQWKERAQDEAGRNVPDIKAFEYLLAEALGGPIRKRRTG